MFGKKNDSVKKRKKKIPKVVIIAAAIILVLGIYVLADMKLGGPLSKKFEDKEASYNTAQVTKGDIAKKIEASGSIQPNDEYSVTSMLKGDIIADYIEEGQQVKDGDVLYEIDPDDVNKNIITAKESIQKAADSLNTAQKNLNDLTVSVDFGGVITELNVKNGDDINAGQTIATVKDTENLVLKIPFNKNDASKIKVGASAEITFASTSSTARGTVKSVSSGSIVNSEGAAVNNVEISVKNPGAIVEGDIATAMVGDVACNSYGTFSYGETKTYTASASGTVTGLSYVSGDKIASGSNLIVIDSDDVASRVNDAQIAYNQAQRQLNDLNEALEDDYRIKAKVTGTVVQKNSKKGDTLDATNGATVMAIIQDVSSLKFSMTVDELDITYMKEGQTVEVTADAVEGVTYTGKIKTVSTVGTSANGVTTYPVEVTLDGEEIEKAEKSVFGEENYERHLIPGMNVDANVIVESREDVLRVPVSAVQRGNTVVVKSGAGKSDRTEKTVKDENKPGNIPETNGEMPEGMPEMPENEQDGGARIPGGITVPDGFETVQVETGISDDNYIEIISGLSEGDEIVVPDVTIETNDNNMFGMMGGMGGGSPMGGGGAPGGGGGAPGGGGGAPGGR